MTNQHSTIILAGGASKRMGCDKASLPWNNSILINYLAQLFCSASRQTIVVASAQQKFAMLPKDVDIVHDETPYPGPLLGVCYGIRRTVPDVTAFITGCDYPLIPAELPMYLLQHLGEADVCVLERDSFRQPLPGLYHPRLLPTLEALIRDGARSMQALLDVVQVVQVREAEWSSYFAPERLLNMNTPVEYEQALLRFAERSMVTNEAGKSCQ